MKLITGFKEYSFNKMNDFKTFRQIVKTQPIIKMITLFCKS